MATDCNVNCLCQKIYFTLAVQSLLKIQLNLMCPVFLYYAHFVIYSSSNNISTKCCSKKFQSWYDIRNETDIKQVGFVFLKKSRSLRKKLWTLAITVRLDMLSFCLPPLNQANLKIKFCKRSSKQGINIQRQLDLLTLKKYVDYTLNVSFKYMIIFQTFIHFPIRFT